MLKACVTAPVRMIATAVTLVACGLMIVIGAPYAAHDGALVISGRAPRGRGTGARKEHRQDKGPVQAQLTEQPLSARPPSRTIGPRQRLVLAFRPQVQRGQAACQGICAGQRSAKRWEGTAPTTRANRPRRRRRPEGAQTPIAVAWLVFSAGGNGGARSTSSRDPATATKIARIASGSSTVAIKRRRPPQRGHASTSTSNARRIRSAHAQ